MENNFEGQEEIDKKFKEILEANEIEDLLKETELNETAVNAIVETYSDSVKKGEISSELLNNWLKETLEKYNVPQEEIEKILNRISTEEEKKTYINPEIKKHSPGLRRKIEFIKGQKQEESKDKEEEENEDSE